MSGPGRGRVHRTASGKGKQLSQSLGEREQNFFIIFYNTWTCIDEMCYYICNWSGLEKNIK